MRSERTRVVVEIALSVGLAAVLSVWKITLPWNIAGGSISLVMLPIFVLAIRRGLWPGILAGAVFGAIDYMIEPWFVHPIQVLLDYGVAYAGCGLAGLGSTRVLTLLRRGERTAALSTAAGLVLLGGTARFVASVISGVVFFASYAPEGQPVLAYSLGYNASYLLPSLLVTGVLVLLIVPAVERAVPVAALAS